MEDRIMWNILGRQMTPYAVSIWAAVILGLLLFVLQGRARKLKSGAMILTAVLGVVLGLLGARGYYVLCRWDLFAEVGWENFFTAQEEGLEVWGAVGGAGFWGAVGGVCLAAWIAGRATGERVSALLDALAPSAALGIALSRFAEYSIGEGIGPEVTVEALRFFPLAVCNEWEEWNYALFLLEGLVAAVIFLILIASRVGKKRDGDQARVFLTLYASAQIVLEAMRRDNFLRWLFVRPSQLVSAMVLLGLNIFGVIRWTRKPPERRMPLKKLIACCVIFALMVPMIIWMEFAVDKSPDLSVGMAYLIETVCCVGMGVCTWQIAVKN
ncbi:MAG: prolipoprotein diacylglyceryl transferase [Clostridia bacterium]|nr:prolipoprotein diacylglyceryl transferase [Clostridia bacterium]